MHRDVLGSMRRAATPAPVVDPDKQPSHIQLQGGLDPKPYQVADTLLQSYSQGVPEYIPIGTTRQLLREAQHKLYIKAPGLNPPLYKNPGIAIHATKLGGPKH